MAASKRFALGVHILALLADNKGGALTSEKIAASAQTNPAFVRRVLLDLTRAGLAQSQSGKGGGSQLAKRPKKITLFDIYSAVDGGRIVGSPKNLSGADCPIAVGMTSVFRGITKDAETAFFTSLKGVSLKQALKRIKAGVQSR